METVNNNIKLNKHKILCESLHETYVKKNAAYGDSFGKTFNDLGIISAVTRISDKYNRLVNLSKNPNVDDIGESLADTLVDMANYCLMTVMELDVEREPTQSQINAYTD